MSNGPLGIRAIDTAQKPTFPVPIRPAAILEALWRRKLMILASGLLVALAALAIGLMLPRTFTSTTQLLIDPRGLRVLDKDISPQSREADQSVSVVESEMRFIVSDLVLERVVQKLKLNERKELGGSSGPAGEATPNWLTPVGDVVTAIRTSVKSMLGRGDTMTVTPDQAALLALQRSVKVARQPNTYVLDVEVKTRDRALSANIADALAREYVAARFTSRGEASRRVSDSINARLEELARQVREADSAVERYKASKDLVSAQGRLLTETRLSELSSQLQVARAETVRAEARMGQVRALRASGELADSNLDGLQSATLERLRANQAVIRQREAALSAQLLPSHPVYRQVRQEGRAVERSIEQEIDRIVETASAALERAKSTERALAAQLEQLKARSISQSSAQVELRELERVAEASRSIYQTFLVRSRELAEQQRIDPNSAVILARAELARSPNGPGLLPLAAAAGIFGMGLGAALALRRDRRDPIVRSSLQLESVIGDQSIHSMSLPRRESLMGRLGGKSREWDYVVAPPGSTTAVSAVRLLREIAGHSPRHDPLVCLVTAAEPAQGKSMVALNLAQAAARVGYNVILIDADRDTTIATREANASGRQGLAEVIRGAAACAAAIIRRSESPVDLLPAGELADLRPTRITLERLPETLFATLECYDLIVVDGGLAGRDRLTFALASRSDAIVFVTMAETGNKTAVEEAADWLSRGTEIPVKFVIIEE